MGFYLKTKALSNAFNQVTAWSQISDKALPLLKNSCSDNKKGFINYNDNKKYQTVIN